MTALVFFGLATSGLSETSDALLEVGAYALDRQSLRFLGEQKYTLSADLDRILPAVDEKVYNTHDANGLWLAVAQSKTGGRTAVDAELASWLDSVGASGSPKSPFFAFGTDWAAKWMRAWLPRTFERLGRDHIDLGVLLRANGFERPQTNGRAIVVAQTAGAVFREMFGHLHGLTVGLGTGEGRTIK